MAVATRSDSQLSGIETTALVNRTRLLIEQILLDCSLDLKNLQAIVAVSEAPAIRSLSRQMATQGPKLYVLPDQSVSQGASLFAAMIVNEGDSSDALKYHIRTVSATAIGIILSGKAGRQIHQLIPRNTPLLATTRFTLSTTRANQTRATEKFFEGVPGAHAVPQVSLRISIDDLPPNLPAESKIDLEVMYDVDGLLHVIGKIRSQNVRLESREELSIARDWAGRR